MAPGCDLNAAETTLRAILADVAKNGVPAELVAAAKIAGTPRSPDSRRTPFRNWPRSGRTRWRMKGLRVPDEDLARIEKVTPADVNRVARKYLDLDHAVTVTMTPQGRAPVALPRTDFGGQESIALGRGQADTAAGLGGKPRSTAWTVPQSTLHPAVSTLANGITLIVQPENVSDTVSVYGHIKNRPETETATGKEGVAEVVECACSNTAPSISTASPSSRRWTRSAPTSAPARISSCRPWPAISTGASALLADNELHPAFSPAAMKSVRDQYSHMVAARMHTPAFLASRSLRESLFSKGDPSLREPLPENIGRLTMDDVLNYYHTTFRPDLTTIVVIGKVTPEQARATIEKYFGAWHAIGPKPKIDLPAVSANHSATLTIADDSKVQDTVALAENVPLARKDSDYYALTLGNAVLAGGFYSSRLSNDLRKKTGLVYSVDADLEAGTTRSVYMVSYACDPTNVAKAAAIVSDELKDMQANPVSNDELIRAKALSVAADAVARGQFRRHRAQLQRLARLGLPLDEPSLAASRYVSLECRRRSASLPQMDAAGRSGAREPRSGTTVILFSACVTLYRSGSEALHHRRASRVWPTRFHARVRHPGRHRGVR